MPDRVLAVHGAFRVKWKGDGKGLYLSHLSYSGYTLEGSPRVVCEDIIETFYDAGDALAALCKRSKQ